MRNLKCKDVNNWPEIKKDAIEKIKFAVQVNGKTRDILTIKKKTNKDEINKIINQSSKAKKFIENKEILKTIFVEDKIINYILKK